MPWPGNVRELANLIERAMILSRGRTLEVPLDDLVRRRPGAGARAMTARRIRMPSGRRSFARWNRPNWVLAGPRGAAARLGMKRTTLQSLMKRLGIAKTRLDPKVALRRCLSIGLLGEGFRRAAERGLPVGEVRGSTGNSRGRILFLTRAVVGISPEMVT